MGSRLGRTGPCCMRMSRCAFPLFRAKGEEGADGLIRAVDAEEEEYVECLELPHCERWDTRERRQRLPVRLPLPSLSLLVLTPLAERTG